MTNEWWSGAFAVGVFLLSWITTFTVCSGQTYTLEQEWRIMCPRIYLNVFTGYAPRGNETAGVYSKKESATSLERCIYTCCNEDLCNVVFMHDKTCFHIECYSNELCLPLFRPEPQFGEHVQMVLVQPLSPVVSWTEVLDQLQADDYRGKEMMMETAETRYPPPGDMQTCEVGMVIDCQPHEICEPVGKHSRNGHCRCDVGYRRNSSGVCVPVGKSNAGRTNGTILRNDVQLPTVPPVSPTKMYSEGVSASVELSSSQPLKQLVVSNISKEVRLPENEVTLTAYTVPAEQSGEHYKYEWNLLSQPEGVNSGTMNDQNGGTMKLSNLIEGLYMFKVAVSAPGAYGEAYANVTVLPAKRINQPPVAIITPQVQTVKLPNTGAVLDGSTSKDDDSIIGWHWELQQGPIGYQPHLVEAPTLQLDNLVLPGNYTFRLTVEDSDHATNSTTANITVLKVTDYPPEANAGQDIIIYLPHNNLTLNGNLSTDDRGIASWEWTKSPSDQDKAVDMQNTRTPYLQLANLEEGMYTFVLKVTDTSGQSSSADVHVFVKPPTNKPPVANAGADVVISLPQTWAVLDGSHSSDDIKIVTWLWEELRGPSKVVFSSFDESHTNVTELTRGEYEIQLTVTDENGNKASDTVLITVTQNKNAPPKANGGGDQTIVLPVSVVVLNGSQSSDDLGIVDWLWTRESNSLALGKVVGNSDHSPILMLTDVVPGRYVFRLRVVDEQGAADEDSVSIILKADPYLHELVELTLNVEGQRLTKAQQDSLEMKLALLLRDDAIIHVRDLRVEDHTGRAVFIFYVEHKTSHNILPGPAVVSRLKEKLTQDSGLLELSVANIQTAVCQNNCSGHGVCEQATRQCLCEAFWMQNLITKHLGNGDSNCDWSILYVVIVLFVGVVTLVGGGWGVVCLCQRACTRRPRKRQKYALLGDDGEDDAMIPRLSQGKIMLSESDSDSDVLYENLKCKLNGDLRNGHSKSRNGFIKVGRRIKT
ncbi:dyslexia-associated protein KIAA0319-like protein isoform X2 [Anabrus simplex]|uniref:dyslexia-associated protein KIAA0319-like protein isoform X2 n=1 Tax=Anabrus simplex TaxID=316456 RepID=UPI0035A29AB7